MRAFVSFAGESFSGQAKGLGLANWMRGAGLRAVPEDAPGLKAAPPAPGLLPKVETPGLLKEPGAAETTHALQHGTC